MPRFFTTLPPGTFFATPGNKPEVPPGGRKVDFAKKIAQKILGEPSRGAVVLTYSPMEGKPKRRRPPANPHKRRCAPNSPGRREISPKQRLGVGGGNASKKAKEDGILSEQQRRFVNHLVHDKMNITAAARLAGYAHSRKAGAQIMASPKIANAIAIEREEYAKASAMTKKRVIDGFLEAVDMARIQADPTPMIQGWTQIAKMCGFYEPTRHKLEVSVNGEVVIQKLQQLDDAQLLALADGQSDVIDGEFLVLEDKRGGKK